MKGICLTSRKSVSEMFPLLPNLILGSNAGSTACEPEPLSNLPADHLLLAVGACSLLTVDSSLRDAASSSSSSLAVSGAVTLCNLLSTQRYVNSSFPDADASLNTDTATVLR